MDTTTATDITAPTWKRIKPSPPGFCIVCETTIEQNVWCCSPCEEALRRELHAVSSPYHP